MIMEIQKGGRPLAGGNCIMVMNDRMIEKQLRKREVSWFVAFRSAKGSAFAERKPTFMRNQDTTRKRARHSWRP